MDDKLIPLKSVSDMSEKFFQERLIVHKTDDGYKTYWYRLNSIFVVMSDMQKSDYKDWYYTESDALQILSGQ